jgi:thiamine kinase-like enzyme
MNPVVRIVQELVPRLGEADSEPTPLDGGITNKNFRVAMGGSEYVIRVPGKDTSLLGIDRGAERDSGELASSLGISPEVVAMLTDPPCLVTRFVEGETLDSEQLRDPATLADVAASLAKLHSSGATLPTEFDSFRVVEDYAQTAADRGVEVPGSYEEAHGHSKRIEAALSGPEHAPVPCHNDLLAANFIRGDQLWIVDWDYAGMGDRYFDLGNFAVNNELDDAAAQAFLTAYFGEEPGERRTATLRLFRFMSDFREAMWGVVQQGISDLDFDFVDYAAKHFQRLRDAAADPAFERAIESAQGK